MGFDLHQLIQKLQPEDPERSSIRPRPQDPQSSATAASPHVSTAVSCRQLLPIRTDGQDSDSRLPVRRLPLPLLRVSAHVQDARQVLEAELMRTMGGLQPTPPAQALTSPRRFLWDEDTSVFQNRTV